MLKKNDIVLVKRTKEPGMVVRIDSKREKPVRVKHMGHKRAWYAYAELGD